MTAGGAKACVAQVITMLELGGAQETALYVVANLDRDRYRPVLVAGDGGLLLGEAKEMPGVEVHVVKELVREVRSVKDVVALARLVALFRRLRPDIVHTNSSKAGILGRWAAWFAGVPVIVHTVHGFGFNDEQGAFTRAFYVFLERLTARVTDRFVAVAKDNVDKGVREGIFREEDAVVIRSGIDVPHFGSAGAGRARTRAGLGLPVDAPVAAMVSCLKPQKSPVDFVRVAERVLRVVPDAHFLQVGDGELRGAMVEEAKRLGVAGRLHLLGWRRDVAEIISASDVLVLTSLWEGLPRVLPQAMAAGKPIVATAVDGTPEAVSDGVNGYLARPHDVERLSEKVALLLGDRALSERMGMAGREMVAEFDEVKMLEDLGSLYERLLKEAAV